jgi:endonuclease III
VTGDKLEDKIVSLRPFERGLEGIVKCDVYCEKYVKVVDSLKTWHKQSLVLVFSLLLLFFGGSICNSSLGHSSFCRSLEEQYTLVWQFVRFICTSCMGLG